MTDKTAPPPIHPLIAERWSPRAFSDRAVTEEQLEALLQAARWAPSCFNDQPWRFIVGLLGRQDGRHAAIVEVLAGGNRVWAERAPLLIVACAHDQFQNGQPNRWAAYDTGGAMLSLTLQAQAMGLHVHQMGGFDVQRTCESFALDEHVVPMAVAAIGSRSQDLGHLPDWAAERETGPRERRALQDLLL